MSDIGKSVRDMDDDELEKFIDLNNEKIRDLENLYIQTVSCELRSFLRKTGNGAGDDIFPTSINRETIEKLFLSKELFLDNRKKSLGELLNEVDAKLIPFMEKYSEVYTELINASFQSSCESSWRAEEEFLTKAMSGGTTYMDTYSSLHDGDF